MSDKLHVVPDATGKITAEVLVTSIKRVADGVKSLAGAGLTEKAIEVLIKNTPACSSLSMTDVRSVLKGLRQLEGEYLEKKR
jgi:predicted TIM-barrel enzyme